ncbi:DUF4383 domain-containing protein [Nocardioides caeni]|uniref:DUF4383 domain-containing protein n=1 Tax=Nocardioides caeni TaxID=574700 RepID=A0A4S8NMV8_9ACTN|nr:DUF4383 domain-containing protein [Nocardioides caeni]
MRGVSTRKDKPVLERIRSRMTSYVWALTDSPVQFGVFVLALWFTSNGPAAYLTCTSMAFDPMNACTTEVAGFIPVTVNLCHTLCHFVTGLIGLVAVLRPTWAAAYASLGFVYYVTWGFVGLYGGEQLRHHLGVDAFGSWVHVVEGLLLLGVWIIHRRVAPTGSGVMLPQT